MARATFAILAALAAVAMPSAGQAANPIKGVIKLPADYPGRFLMKAAGHWLLPNDVLDVLPPVVDPRTERMVAVEGQGVIGASLVKPVMRLEDARFQPAVLPVAPHTKVSFENKDAVTYTLESVGRATIPKQQLQPGQTFAHVFDTPGTYSLRALEQPHLKALVFVTGVPLFVQPDGNGAFVFPDLRPGTYTLSVWYREKWIHKQQLVVKPGRATVEVQLKSLPGKD